MANLKALKSTIAAADKGAPPSPSQTTANLAKPPREARGGPVIKGKIEFSVPESVVEAFGEEAARRFGFKKGSKSELFLALWADYMARQSR